jgi:hypothetical protein
MSTVILQPAGKGAAKEHYSNTIANPVQLSRMEKYLSPRQVAYLREIYGERGIPVWGTTPGDKNRNKKQWEKVQKGDIALFTGDNKIFSSAVVTYKIHNKKLAEALWGWKEEGITWEYIYFLDEVKKHDIPVMELNNLLGYSPNNVIRGFRVLDEKKSLKVLQHFDFSSDKYFPDVSEDEYKTIVEQYMTDESLDKERVGKSRKEQAFLRRFLFGDKKSEYCGICGKEYPVEFLITAHIKKRAECSKEEKLDYKNIVMPMCTFGCDVLYEKGYISVVNGVISLLKDESELTSVLKDYLDKIIGRKCSYWNNRTRKYFEWHYNHHS